jgi:hypothetical protein
MTQHRTIAATLALALLCAATGCPKKAPPAPPTPTPSNTGLGGSLGRAPEGGSQTLAGKIRDRAVDTQILNEMGQVRTALEADSPEGNGPANTAGWLALLRDFRHLRPMVASGEVVAYPNVNVQRQPPGTVLMYETRAAQGDGIVLFCDGSARRVQSKEEFAALPRPKP